MLNATVTIQEDGESIVEPDIGVLRSLDSLFDMNGEVSEERINTDTPCFMDSDGIIDNIRVNTFNVVTGVNIIRQLRLVEVSLTILSVPLQEVAKSVLSRKTIANHIVSIDLKTSCYRILSSSYLTSDVVVSAPKPSVINDYIARVNLKHDLGLNLFSLRASYSSKDIVNSSRCGG